MAKSYNFRINLQKAEFSDHFVSVHFGGPETRYAEIAFTGTLAEAIAKRAELSAADPRPHVAFVRMANRSDRKPPGFKNVPDLHKKGE